MSCQSPSVSDPAIEDQEREASELHELANSIVLECKQNRPVSTLETAIFLLRQVLNERPPSHPLRSNALHHLSTALSIRFSQWGWIEDHYEAVKTTLQSTGIVDHDSDVITETHTTAQKRTFDSEEQAEMIQLSIFSLTEFHQSVSSSSINTAIYLYHDALFSQSLTNPKRLLTLFNLSDALVMRFHLTGKIEDLNEGISRLEEALHLRLPPDPERFRCLISLCMGLCLRFHQTSQLQDTLNVCSLSLKVAKEDEEASELLRSENISDLFGQSGAVLNLDKAVELLYTLLWLHPALHPFRSRSLNSLANVLLIRFQQKGQLADLEESIAFHREALVLIPAPHPLRSGSLNNLASALSTRFEQKGQLADLEESIAFYQEALVLTPAPHPLRSRSLNNLANALWTQFQQKGQLADLEESIAFYQEALVLLPAPHLLRSSSLNNLASALQTRFQQKGQLADLEESIAFHREALVLFPAPHPLRSTSLNNLASALLAQFEQKGQLADLEESIASHRAALVLTPAPHPLRFSSLKNLAFVLWTRFQQKGQPADLEESMVLYSDASKYETGSVIQRFDSSRAWAHRAASVHHSSAMQAYQHSINLLPHLASLNLNIQQRQDALSRACGLACDACHYAIESYEFDKAVEFLSAGRAVFWSQALQLRTPFDELQSVAPDLADKVQGISHALEVASAYDGIQTMHGNSQEIRDLEKEATHYRILNEDWNCALEEVRKLEGFEDFLQPKSIGKLKQASLNGPVVMLNATASGCDALVITQDKVKHIPLPDISFRMTCNLHAIIQRALFSNGIYSAADNDILEAHLQLIHSDNHRKGMQIPDAGCTPEDLFEVVLGVLWFNVVHPVICDLNLKKSDVPARIWWCPTGPFSFLPIHAAGIYKGDDAESLSDYAISSYTPTLDALLTSPPPKIQEPNMLAVIQPKMPGNAHLNLPCTVKELGMIEQHVPEKWLTRLGIEEVPTSVARVLSYLPDASFAHFACHGSQDIVNPLNSALLLSDGELKVSKIMQNRIPNASLVFLSACETAKGAEDIPDEAMHLAATMLFVGFRGVVGTMWSMYDEDGPKVADIFYGHIFGAGHETYPDSTKAAEALHLAVKKLRKEKVSFERWIPFIHLGI